MGGEKHHSPQAVAPFPGSPPHGRGKVDGTNVLFLHAGITPAWAGKSCCTPSPCPLFGDHPRMGGEKTTFGVSTIFCRGSPPHGRGKACPAAAPLPRCRITPAWAGKRHPIPCKSRTGWDHPRMGGEKCNLGVLHLHGIGSPPHGRGKVQPRRFASPRHRITPAWAGKRCPHSLPRHFWRDHPRMGGEKASMTRLKLWQLGSPPHGRGKECGGVIFGGPTGITPAWAGKRLKRSHRSGIFISGPIPFHSVLHRPAGSGGSRAGRDGSPAGQPQNAGPA